jgi:hypothetical protein
MGAAALGPTHAAALTVIAVEWALAMPALVWLEQRVRAGSDAERKVEDVRFAP